MKKSNGILTVIILSLFLIINGNINAQSSNHVYTLQKWKVKIPANGSGAELNKLLKEWHDKIVMKNDKVISERVLRHNTGSDSRDLLIITEYANWNDIEAADKLQWKLFDEAWPNKDDRKKFFDTWNKYAKYHSDEIMTGRAKLRK